VEAATPLRTPHVRTVGGDRVAVDGLVIEDDTAVRLVREREDAGDDTVALLIDALEIGARVLDREQTGANAEYVKTEFERAARELQSDFGERARAVTDTLATEFERRFSDGSSEAVQHRVKELVGEANTRLREDLARQLSAEDPSNPLAAFQKAALAALNRSAEQQDANLRAMRDRIAELQQELQAQRSEKEKQLELAEERDRGTAKGRDYEESVGEAIDAIAGVQGDDCDAVGDLKGTTRKTGDIVVGIEGARGPVRGRIVFEAKNSKLPKPEAMRELDRGRAEREADYAVLVVPSEDKLPARTQALREYSGDKLLAVYDPDDGSALGLELAYRLARARVLMARGGDDAIDSAALADTVERALGAMEEVRSIKQKLTGARSSIDAADDLLEAMATTVRGHLARMDELLAAGEDAD
jgi:HAMP domain-containing protein